MQDTGCLGPVLLPGKSHGWRAWWAVVHGVANSQTRLSDFTFTFASLSITNSRSSLRLMSIESVMPLSHLILCRPLLLLPPIPPSIRVFSNESTLRMRWPKYWSFSFSIIPSNDGDLSLPLGLALGSPIFPSGCEGKLGVALESLQGRRDLT